MTSPTAATPGCGDRTLAANMQHGIGAESSMRGRGPHSRRVTAYPPAVRGPRVHLEATGVVRRARPGPVRQLRLSITGGSLEPPGGCSVCTEQGGPDGRPRDNNGLRCSWAPHLTPSACEAGIALNRVMREPRARSYDTR
jgi:hypothetical protein